MYGHIQIVLTYTKNVNNVIPPQEKYVAFGYTTLRVGRIKVSGNISINILKYLAWGLGLANNIILNMVQSVFHHIPSGGEGKKIIV